MVSQQNPDLSDAEIAWYMNVDLAHCKGHSLIEKFATYPYPS